MKKKIIIGICLVALIIIGVFINLSKKTPAKVESDADSVIITDAKIVCQIKGEVMRPGVYSLNKGARLQDLVNAAGGFTNDANVNSINLVSVLQDNSCYTIDRIKEIKEEEHTELININLATKEELMSLTGIGEAKAIAIIEYRNQNGKFASINDLIKVNGISEKMLKQIIDQICAE